MLLPLPTTVALIASFLTIRVAAPNPPGWPFDVTTLTAPDKSITVKFVSVGATLTELWVRDKIGKFRDIVLGYDDNTRLLTDPAHPYFGPVVGRYANRIKNGMFSIPPTRNTPANGTNVFHTPLNENGLDTLHGGTIGWDRRNWTIAAKSSTSVTFKHVDHADEGFPGTVTAFVTYTVSNDATLHTSMHATATDLTPIMLAQHLYWNLDAYQGSDTILNHFLQLDSLQVIATDSILVPTGGFIDTPGTPYDFREPHTIGSRINDTVGFCGAGCTGYDTCFIFNKKSSPQTSSIALWSTLSGIRLDISTDQPAFQVYSGNGLNIPRKVVHGGPSKNYTKWSAVVIEQESYIDAINNPQWKVDQIFGPGKDYEWSSVYKFSVLH